MQRIDRLVDQLLRQRSERDWSFDPDRAILRIGEARRHQDIRLKREGDDYVLTSVVLPTATAKKTNRDRRQLARLAWERNADQEIVTFGFDHRHRFVGQIRHPAAQLDPEELDVYIESLARECDRFEYLLSGMDAY